MNILVLSEPVNVKKVGGIAVHSYYEESLNALRVLVERKLA